MSKVSMTMSMEGSSMPPPPPRRPSETASGGNDRPAGLDLTKTSPLHVTTPLASSPSESKKFGSMDKPPRPTAVASPPAMTGAPKLTEPTEKEPTSSPVKGMVDKAKRIAGQIWILLHARGCSAPNCELLHCRQTKTLYRLARAHQQGVQLTQVQKESIIKARKLLQHYHDCRAQRLGSTPKSPHFCLVCSLVARARMARDGEDLHKFKLDFSTSPVEGTANLFQLPSHGHNTRNGGRRPRSSSCGSERDNIHTSASRQQRRQKSSTSQSSSTGRKRSNSLSSMSDLPVPEDEIESLQLGASLLSVLSQRDTQQLAEPALKRSRSASWGGEWASEKNTAADLLSENHDAKPTPLEPLLEAVEVETSRPTSQANNIQTLADVVTSVAGSSGNDVDKKDACLSLMQLAGTVSQVSPAPTASMGPPSA